jgi:signal transduction histidine kinase
MLSGIAHDLRTPLARQRLTLESMGASADPQLLAVATQDLEEMNRLIKQYLQLGQVLSGDRPETIDVRDIRSIAWKRPAAAVQAAAAWGSILRVNWHSSTVGKSPWIPGRVAAPKHALKYRLRV